MVNLNLGTTPSFTGSGAPATDGGDPLVMELPTTTVLPIDSLVPYFNNPRTITDEAIEAVRESLSRYGYMQPIVVDADHVVVVGHTRLEALKRLGVTEVPVYVADKLTEEQAREYRLVDNRTGEFTDWDQQSLVSELRELDTALLDKFFPDVDLEVAQLDAAAVSEDDVEAAIDNVTTVKEAEVVRTTKVTCPSCFYTFDVKTDSLPGGRDVAWEDDDDDA